MREATARAPAPHAKMDTKIDPAMSRENPQQRRPWLVRTTELIPCRTAFIDAHTPGSDKKENFTIIGGGVSESPDQHVHIPQTPGFNIGAAGQPPGCRNSLHAHRTAEVFFVLTGVWRFFWGKQGETGSVTLGAGDVFNIPTGIFRGFENIGTDYGVLMAVLGGDDAGGGVVWAPQVLEEARHHGLILAETGRIYDTRKGEKLPETIRPMPELTAEAFDAYPDYPARSVIPKSVARYLDLVSMARDGPLVVIGENGVLRDRPGFELSFMTSHASDQAPDHGPGGGRVPRASGHDPRRLGTPEVLMGFCGHWRLEWTWGRTENLADNPGEDPGGTLWLGPGDVCLIPPGLTRRLLPHERGTSSLYLVHPTTDPAGPTLW